MSWPSSPRLAALLVALLGLAAALRVGASFLDGPLHPDEYFQYLEPAWWRLSGVGIEAWEWRDGIRSWVLPAYNGGWLAALRALGLPDGPPLVWALRVHWALLNAALAYVAYRGGAAVSRRLARVEAPGDDYARGAEGGLVAALLVATFPLLVIYAGHTLSELPSMFCLVAGLVLTFELTERGVAPMSPASLRKAAWIGALLSLGACLRIASAPLVLVAPAWLLLTGRLRAFGWLCAGALAPAFLFAAADRITWGSWAHSYVAYVKFNLLEGRAANFGTEPPLFYVKQLGARLPYGLVLIVLPALYGLRATWPLVASALLTVGYLSTQPHKEERFMIAVWAFVLIPAGGVLGRALAVLRSRGSSAASSRGARTAYWVVGLVLPLFVVGDGAMHAGGRTWPERHRVDAQAWLSQRPGRTFVLVDEPIFGAGGLWLGGQAPQIRFAPALLANPLMSHAIVRTGSPREREAVAAGFRRVHQVDEFVVLERGPAR
jgi:GPI mannosyltransferase 3